MAHYGKHPSLNHTTESVDANVWHWFICNGPHGERFSWHRDSPHPKRNIELLSEFINQREAQHPGFISKAHIIALDALEDENPIIVLTGIQVLTVVGENNDFSKVEKLLSHPDERVVKNARAALFERGFKKIKS